MIRIAICDDESAVLEQVDRIVWRFCVSRKDGPVIQTEKYGSPLLLCDKVTGGKPFDIVILDVEMPEMNGFQAAECIRESDPATAILFLTSHTEFPTVRESFKVGAFRYVSKLDIENSLPEALNAAIALCGEQEKSYLTLTWYNNAVRVPLNEIRYVRRVSRTLEIITEKQGTLHDSRSLGGLLKSLNDPRFISVDRSTFVNLDHVLEVSDSGLILKGGEEISVSRKMMPQVKQAILRVWGGIQ